MKVRVLPSLAYNFSLKDRKQTMQVITAQTKEGYNVLQEQYKEDLIKLQKKFDQACLTSPMFSIFGGVITLDNGNKYQVCG